MSQPKNLQNRYSGTEPFHDAWMEHFDEPHQVRLAHAIVVQWLGSRMVIRPEELIVGEALQVDSIVTWSFVGGVKFDNGLWEGRYQDADENERKYLERMKSTWHGKSTGEIARSVVSPKERAVSRAHAFVGAGCHASPLHVRLASEGTEGLRQRVKTSRLENSGKPGTEPEEWYDALVIILSGIDAFAETHAKLTWREAQRELNPERREILLEISDRCSRILKRPAENFHDALQAYWFSSILHGVDSPGRFDQDMASWLINDLETGVLAEERAQELVDAIFLKFKQHRAWSLTLGGQRPEGGDATNPLTYMVLDSMRRLRVEAPNVSLRVHRHTPEKLLSEACDLIASGLSMPALVNDEPVITAMLERGIALEHARDYTLVGCTQVVPRGRCGGSYEDLVINSLKAVELALHNGFDPIIDEETGLKTGEPEELLTYEDFEEACFKQMDFIIRTSTEVVNRQLAAVSRHISDHYKSLLIEGCLENGKDYRRGGALYTEGLADVLGITNFGDALLVVKKLVYEEGRFSLREFVDILEDDWEGHEPLRQECSKRVSKFGNDDEDADALTLRVFNFINGNYKRREKVFGNRYGIDVVGWTGAVNYGRQTGATPDGRKKSTPLCDSVGASQGCDTNGVTALLQSVSRIPHDKAHGILALNLKFSANTFKGEKGIAKMKSLINTAFGLGLQQLQINVVDANTLREAQIHPEQYSSLVVRIGGFSTYFNWLSKGHQDDIIARTEHKD